MKTIITIEDKTDLPAGMPPVSVRFEFDPPIDSESTVPETLAQKISNALRKEVPRIMQEVITQ